jgi:hypothetical protein
MRLRNGADRAGRILRLREVLVLVERPPPLPLGTTFLANDLDVRAVFITKEGENILLGFTSEKALLQWRAEGGPFIGLDGETFIGLALQHSFDRVVIDPGQANCLEVSRAELSALVQPD